LPVRDPAAGEAGIAASWTSYQTLVARRGLTHAGLAELLGLAAPARATLGGPMPSPAAAPAAAPDGGRPVVPIESLEPDEPDVVPIEALAPSAPAAGPSAALAGDEADVVPIEDLLYDGEGARWRLRAVRVELDAALATSGTDPKIRSLLGEVFDLLDVGFSTPR
jgi:hypothetical protein